MNLTPPTPAPKRVRAKAAAEPKTEPAKKPTLTTKAKRAPKKLVAPTSTVPVIDTAVHADVARADVARSEAGTSYTSDQLRALIEKAAYYRAESRHFAPGNDMEDWLVAEQQVIASLT